MTTDRSTSRYGDLHAHDDFIPGTALTSDRSAALGHLGDAGPDDLLSGDDHAALEGLARDVSAQVWGLVDDEAASGHLSDARREALEGLAYAADQLASFHDPGSSDAVLSDQSARWGMLLDELSDYQPAYRSSGAPGLSDRLW